MPFSRALTRQMYCRPQFSLPAGTVQVRLVSQPELTRRGKEFLRAGYAKLTGYECKNHGFEWFGADPGHEALTAYGLLEFRDMARVHDVA